MRILIDECIDERFRNALTGHDCQTARYAGLAGLKNGILRAKSNRLHDLLQLVPPCLAHIESIQPGQIVSIEPTGL